MHTKDTRYAVKESSACTALNVWRETPFFTDRGRAALEWTESVTRISETHVPDEAYERVHKCIGERDLVDLTLGNIVINGWNRLAVGFRTVPGTYQRPNRTTKRLWKQQFDNGKKES